MKPDKEPAGREAAGRRAALGVLVGILRAAAAVLALTLLAWAGLILRNIWGNNDAGAARYVIFAGLPGIPAVIMLLFAVRGGARRWRSVPAQSPAGQSGSANVRSRLAAVQELRCMPELPAVVPGRRVRSLLNTGDHSSPHMSPAGQSTRRSATQRSRWCSFCRSPRSSTCAQKSTRSRATSVLARARASTSHPRRRRPGRPRSGRSGPQSLNLLHDDLALDLHRQLHCDTAQG